MLPVVQTDIHMGSVRIKRIVEEHLPGESGGGKEGGWNLGDKKKKRNP